MLSLSLWDNCMSQWPSSRVSSWYMMCIIQVKVHSDQTLNIHVITSQGRICVQCVTNGLEVKHICMSTE